MICQHCGATLPPIAMFCGECGRSVAARTPVVPPVPLTSSVMPFSASEPLSITPATPPEPDEPLPPAPAAPVARGPWTSVAATPEVSSAPVTPAAPEPAAEGRLAAAIRPEAHRCPRCGSPAEPDDLYCGTCGEPLASDTRVIEPVAEWVVEPVSAPPADRASADSVPETTADPSGPAAAVVDRGPEPVLEPDTESTRLVPRGSTGARFVLQFSTGESYTVIGSGIIGRNPHPEPGEVVDHIVTIVDPGRSVSKSHLEFGQDNGVFWVSDRHSGNGSVIREPGSEPRYCEPGRRYRVIRGTRIDLGEQFVIVS